MEEQDYILFEGETYYSIAHENFVGSDLVISESGKILNKKTKRLRKILDNGNFIYENRKKVNVGRLVGLTFLTLDGENNYKVLSKKKIKHIDGNNTNNHISNLQW